MTDSYVDIDAGGGGSWPGPLHVRMHEGSVHNHPPVVFLHEGLGSLDLWKGFVDDVRAALGDVTTMAYSRHGYGRSAAARGPRAVTYMHDEALLVLPPLLAELGLECPLLVGHSDGASIAIIHAGSGHPVAGLVLIAPHVFVEDVGVDAIEQARIADPATASCERASAVTTTMSTPRFGDGTTSGWPPSSGSGTSRCTSRPSPPRFSSFRAIATSTARSPRSTRSRVASPDPSSVS